MRCILVDDEPLARSRLEALLRESETDVELVGQFGSAREALPIIHELEPDVVFVDVQMPVLDGFDLVDLLVPPRPAIVFVTAFDEYAIKAFEVHALDYLTKPVRLERLNKCLVRISERKDGHHDKTTYTDQVKRNNLSCLTTKVGTRLRVLQVSDVSYIESEEKLTLAAVKDRKYAIHFTLDELEHKLDSSIFVRTHRSCIVNTAFVRELIPWFSGTYKIKLKDGAELPVARRRVKDFKEALGF